MRARRASTLPAGVLVALLMVGCTAPGPAPQPEGAGVPTGGAASSATDTGTAGVELEATPAEGAPTLATPSAMPSEEAPSPQAATPEVSPSLAGLVVVVDPGHQLGNRHFPRKINASVDAGNGSTKACNTTGSATSAGVPEATINWDVSSALVASLRERGAEVILTREENSDDLWGPCIDVRGSTGNDRADLLVSVHADGADSSDHGFHLLLPATSAEIYPESLRLGELVRGALDGVGIDRATYVADAMRASDDYATLNHSAKPAAILEMGNMRHAGDAAAMTSPDGQARYVAALTAAVEQFAAGRAPG